LQRDADFGQWQSEHLKGPNPVKPPQVLLGVAAVAGSRSPASGQQPDLVIVMECPDRDAAPFRKFTDTPQWFIPD
jgi:hypothetical protein